MHATRNGQTGFSLAETMIAIVILGIGLLMAAAAFPIGVSQSRIVSELTIAPLVADEAANLIRRELANSNYVQINVDCWRENWTELLPPGKSIPGCPGADADFNGLFQQFTTGLGFAEADIRAYPFGIPAAAANYSWSFMMRFLPGTDVVQVVVLVNNAGIIFVNDVWTPIDPEPVGDPVALSFMQIPLDGGSPEAADAETPIERLRLLVTNADDRETLAEGSVILRGEDGEIITLGARDEELTVYNRHYYFVRQQVLDPTEDVDGWALPVDPRTHRPLVIGIFHYTFAI